MKYGDQMIQVGSLFGGGVTSDLVQNLLDDIRNLKYKAGDKLPSQRELCEIYSVGRGSVREALRTLQAMGFIKVISGKGAYVQDTKASIKNFFVLWNAVYPISIQSLVEVRFAIEPLASSLAAEKAKRENLIPLQEALEDMEKAMTSEHLEEKVDADVRFHRNILQLAGNPIFINLYLNMDPLLRESRRISLLLPERAKKVHRYHQKIYEAIQSNDPVGAYWAMWDHLRSFTREMNIQVSLYDIFAEERKEENRVQIPS